MLSHAVLSSSTGWESFVDVLRSRALLKPDQMVFTYLVEGEAVGESLTFGQLDRAARAIAARLQAQVPPGTRALMLYPSGLEFVAAFFGCLYAGVIGIPAYPPRKGRGQDRLEGIIQDASASLVLTTAELQSDIEKASEASPLSDHRQVIATDLVPVELSDAWQPYEPQSDDIAFLQYTSGSTGAPKGVMVTHRNLLYNSANIRAVFGLSEASCTVCWTPSFHDMGLIDGVLQPVFTGYPAYLMDPAAFIRRPLRWLKAISRFRATHSGGPNFAYDLCVRRATSEGMEGLDLSSWRTAFNAAEPIRSETFARFSDVFAPSGFRRESCFSGYGLAEATLIVTGGLENEYPTVVAVDRQALQENHFVPVPAGPGVATLVSSGRVWGDTQLLIVQPTTLRPCEAGEVGEIWVGGPTVAKGYWKRPAATAETFGAELADGRGPFLRTGDFGVIHGGEVFITGRMKDVLIVRGRNYYPQDLEHTAEAAHPALRPGCSAAFSAEVAGEEGLVMAVEWRATAGQSVPSAEETETIVSAIRRAIAETYELRLHAVILLEAGTIPKTSSGKIQRRACREGYTLDRLTVLGHG